MDRLASFLSLQVYGRASYMMKFSFTTRATGERTTIFGSKFRKPTGKMSSLSKREKMRCIRICEPTRQTYRLLIINRCSQLRLLQIRTRLQGTCDSMEGTSNIRASLNEHALITFHSAVLSCEFPEEIEVIYFLTTLD
jgi:hypothetical protein